MTYEEAFEVIKNELPNTSEVIEQALYLVGECVNKQIQKKVILGDDDQDYVTCPDCRIEIAMMDSYRDYESHVYNSCPNCGKKLDWR